MAVIFVLEIINEVFSGVFAPVVNFKRVGAAGGLVGAVKFRARAAAAGQQAEQQCTAQGGGKPSVFHAVSSFLRRPMARSRMIGIRLNRMSTAVMMTITSVEIALMDGLMRLDIV